MPTQMESDKPKSRRPYGRVYLFAAGPKYSARIWDEKGRDIWNVVTGSPDDAYAAMKVAAEGMSGPVDLYRHGGQGIEETTLGKELPF